MWNAKNKVWNKVICSILTNFAAEIYFSSEEKYQVFSKSMGVYSPGSILAFSAATTYNCLIIRIMRYQAGIRDVCLTEYNPFSRIV